MILGPHVASFLAYHQKGLFSSIHISKRADGVQGRRNKHTEHLGAGPIQTVEIDEMIFHIQGRISLCHSRELLSKNLSNV